MESQLISKFIKQTGATPKDAILCLRTWGWDLKRALIDYNDTDIQHHSSHELFPDELTPNQNYIKTSKINDILEDNISNNSDIHNSSTKKSILNKVDSIDVVDYRKLSRGISRATDNAGIVSKARTEIAMDFKNNTQKNVEQLQINPIDAPDSTFILPNIYNYSEHFRNFLEKDLIELSTLNALEQASRLNWWVDNGICKKLWPLATTGDGNCLLHAASLGMWGFHDRKLTLRKALHNVLSNGKQRDALWRRWRFQQTRLNKKAGLVLSEVEWAKEWDELISLSSPEPRNSGNSASRRRISTSDRHSLISSESIDDTATYESLEEVHILALSHVLRRPIIVISETVLKDLNGEAMAPVFFGGIYLPYEVDPNECNRGPLVLAYDMGHFSALVPMENEADYPPALIPLTDCENLLLPIQFCIDPGENFDWKSYDGNEGNWALTEREQIALLKEYLDIVYVSTAASPDEDAIEDLTDDEFEKKYFADTEVVINSQFMPVELESQGKSKAAKQLQSVAKQFGSIGKSMSKKFKKNIGSITKIGGNNKSGSNSSKSSKSSMSSTQSFTFTRLLCAKLRIRRHEFQDRMIKNYIDCARNRYLDNEKVQRGGFNDFDTGIFEQDFPSKDVQKSNNDITYDHCINAGCQNFGSSETSYLCSECFVKQKQNESNTTFVPAGPRYGTGKSKFYAQADALSHENIRNIPPAKRLTDLDQTLYLSNSTFYNDNVPLHRNSENNKPLTNSNVYTPNVRVIKVELETEEPPKVQSTTLNSKSQTLSLGIGTTINTNSSQLPLESINITSLPQTQQCRSKGCPYYGTINTNFFCSKCYQNIVKTDELIDLTSKISINNGNNSQPQTTIYPTVTANIPKTGSKIMSDI